MKKSNTFKRSLAMLLAALIVLGSIAILPLTVAAAAPTPVCPAGDGGEAHPFEITSAANLVYVTKNPDLFFDGYPVYFILVNDVDMSGFDFYPIYAGTTPVVLNGNGYAIRGLTVGSADAPYRDAALFSAVGGGSAFYDLSLTSVAIYGESTAAALVGRVTTWGDMTFRGVKTSGTISARGNCSVSNDNVISNTSVHAAAFVATNTYAEAETKNVTYTAAYCRNDASVTSYGIAGGMFASVSGPINFNFSYSGNTGAVSSTMAVSDLNANVAGFVGHVGHGYSSVATSVSVSYCYNTGALSTASADAVELGGIFGDYRTYGIKNLTDTTYKNTFVMDHTYDYSARTRSSTANYHSAFAGFAANTEIPHKYFTDCYAANASGSTNPYSSLHQYAVNPCTFTRCGIVGASGITFTLSDLTAAIEAINTQIAAHHAITEPAPDTTLDISSAGRKLQIRLKLSDPFGLMAITSLTVDGNTVATKDYEANGVTEYGFYFMKSDTKVSAERLRDQGRKATGARYDAENFYAIYDKMSAAALDETIYFAAYAEIGGTLHLSAARSITPIQLVEQGKNGQILGVTIELAEERTLYGAMYSYHKQYEDYYGSEIELKVASYNINFGLDNRNPSNLKSNLDNVVNVIADNDLDIVALQEVHIYTSVRDVQGKHQPYEIAKKLNEKNNGNTYYWAFAAGLEGQHEYKNAYDSFLNFRKEGPKGWFADGFGNDYKNVSQSGYGNAIISKYPILNAREIKVMGPNQTSQLQNGYERRVILIVDLDVNGQTVTVMSTHFDLKEDARIAAAQTAVAEAAKINNPVILMGDLNCAVGSTPINTLRQRFEHVAPSNATPTFHNGGQIDHILYANCTATVTNYRILSNNYVSDHMPVLATLKIYGYNY